MHRSKTQQAFDSNFRLVCLLPSRSALNPSNRSIEHTSGSVCPGSPHGSRQPRFKREGRVSGRQRKKRASASSTGRPRHTRMLEHIYPINTNMLVYVCAVVQICRCDQRALRRGNRKVERRQREKAVPYNAGNPATQSKVRPTLVWPFAVPARKRSCQAVLKSSTDTCRCSTDTCRLPPAGTANNCERTCCGSITTGLDTVHPPSLSPQRSPPVLSPISSTPSPHLLCMLLLDPKQPCATPLNVSDLRP